MRFFICSTIILCLASATPAAANPSLRSIVGELAGGLASALVSGDSRSAEGALRRAGQRALRTFSDKALRHLSRAWAHGMPAVEHVRRCAVCRKAARAMTQGKSGLRAGLRTLLDGHAESLHGHDDGGLFGRGEDDLFADDDVGYLPPPPPPRAADRCVVPTQWGQPAVCPLYQRIPVGAPCWCQFANGMRGTGYAR